MPAMLMCPVCLYPIRDSYRGALPSVEQHYDAAGKLCPMSGEPIPEWTERFTRQAVRGRSGGICENCQLRRATEMHHRKNRSQGGQWHPANIIDLCSECHRWVTVNPDHAGALGLGVGRNEDPENKPVTRADGMVIHLSDYVTTRGKWADF